MSLKVKLIAFATALLSVAVIGVVQLNVRAVGIDTTRDCDKTAIIHCGAMTEAELVSKYRANAPGDLPAVYKAFGVNNLYGMVNGEVYRNGDVYVGGKKVATGAMTAARNMSGGSIPGSNAKVINPSVWPAQYISGKPAFVRIENGVFKYAVLKTCGNPIKANPIVPPKPPAPKPVYRCDGLSAKSLTRDQYQFAVAKTATNGAVVKSYDLNFGDGKTVNTLTPTITHAYAKAGTYTATAKVNVQVNGKTVVAPGTCIVTLTVAPENCPVPGKEQYPKDSPKCKEDKPAIEITKTVNDVEHVKVDVNEQFTYQVVVKNTGDVALKNAVVTDKAPAEVTLLTASAGKIDGNTWTYTIPELKVGESKSFTITAKYGKYVAGTHVNNVCVDTPTVPGSPDDCDEASTETHEKITVCDTNDNTIKEIERDEFDESHMTTDKTKCAETPEVPELPKTGLSDTLSSILGLGGIVGTGAAYLASRRSIR